VKGYAEILDASIKSEPEKEVSSPPPVQVLLENIASSTTSILACSTHICGLLDNMLDLSKLRSGRLKLKDERFTLRQLFDTVRTITAPLAKPGVELRLRIAGRVVDGYDGSTRYDGSTSESIVVRGDFLRWKQLLLNMVTNALQITTRGTVTMDGRQCAHTPHSLLLSVTDTGPGEWAPSVASADSVLDPYMP
jgi:signal transduction histidine kinase